MYVFSLPLLPTSFNKSVIYFLGKLCFYLVHYPNFEILSICILLSFWAPVF